MFSKGFLGQIQHLHFSFFIEHCKNNFLSYAFETILRLIILFGIIHCFVHIGDYQMHVLREETEVYRKSSDFISSSIPIKSVD